MLSLGVAAFADGADAQNADVETVGIGFDLSSSLGCALLMRSVEYDDIRLNGISYKPDASDGVITLQLADLAAAKLLTDYAAEAEQAGLDLAKLYISGGRVCVDKTGMTDETAAALASAVEAFMSSYKVSVSVGDEFTLSNGAVAKLKLCVLSFACTSPQTAAKEENAAPADPLPVEKETKLNFVAFNEKKYYYSDVGSFATAGNGDADEVKQYFNSNEINNITSAKTPDVTTVFFQYYSADKTKKSRGDSHAD